MNVSDKLIAH